MMIRWRTQGDMGHMEGKLGTQGDMSPLKDLVIDSVSFHLLSRLEVSTWISLSTTQSKLCNSSFDWSYESKLCLSVEDKQFKAENLRWNILRGKVIWGEKLGQKNWVDNLWVEISFGAKHGVDNNYNWSKSILDRMFGVQCMQSAELCSSLPWLCSLCLPAASKRQHHHTITITIIPSPLPSYHHTIIPSPSYHHVS